ncbi:MAG: asparagine synthase C-terminal domain-containing protein [bacterium]
MNIFFYLFWSQIAEEPKKSIKKRLMSDVPLGIFLSGGIDSSSIVALLSEIVPNKKITTLNIAFTERSYDESNYAQFIARHFNTNHHQTVLRPDVMINIFPKIIRSIDEPFADPSIIPTYLLCEFARQYVVVALGGDGGDELFAGYDPFLANQFIISENFLYYISNLLKKILRFIPCSGKNMNLNFKMHHFLKGIMPYTKNNIELRNILWLSSFTPDIQDQLFKQNDEINIDYHSIYAETFSHKNKHRAQLPIDKLIDTYVSLYLHDDILVKVDRVSMMHSLEVRAPFLDKAFSEFINRLPVSMKIKGLNRKYILKKAMYSKLPKAIIYRSKKGFGIPIAQWFRGPLRSMLLDTFSSISVKKNSLFNHHYIGRLINEHLKLKEDNRKEIWTLFVFELWRQHCNVNL